MRGAVAAASLVAALAACGGGAPVGDAAADAFDGPASEERPKAPFVPTNPLACAEAGLATGETAVVHVGPDVSVELPCGGTASVPVASIGSAGGAGFWWKVTFVGDASVFRSPVGTSFSCPHQPPSVLSVDITAPATASPGDTFDATLTVETSVGAAGEGTVKIHAVVGAPKFSLEPTTIDFGDVPYGEWRHLPVQFSNPTRSQLLAETVQQEVAPFSFAKALVVLQPRMTWPEIDLVTLAPADMGEHTAEIEWRAATRQGTLPEACVTRKTVKLRANVVPSADAGP